MNCREFQKIIPDIVKDELPDELLAEAIEHMDSCKDCAEELEIHYIVDKGFDSDVESTSMNYLGNLELVKEKLRRKNTDLSKAGSLLLFLYTISYTVIGGCLIYVVFHYFI